MEAVGKFALWVLRVLAGMALLGFSVVAQGAFDTRGAELGVRMAWLAALVLVLTVVFVLMLIRVRRSDEGQRRVVLHRMMAGAISGIVFAMIWHIAAHLGLDVTDDWPILSLPAWIVLGLAIDSRRSPKDHEYR